MYVFMPKKIKLENTLLIGLGAASIAKERAQDFVDFVLKQGKLAAKDQKKLRSKLIKQGQREYASMSKAYEKAVRQTLAALNIPTRSEFEALKRKVSKKK